MSERRAQSAVCVVSGEVVEVCVRVCCSSVGAQTCSREDTLNFCAVHQTTDRSREKSVILSQNGVVQRGTDELQHTVVVCTRIDGVTIALLVVA